MLMEVDGFLLLWLAPSVLLAQVISPGLGLSQSWCILQSHTGILMAPGSEASWVGSVHGGPYRGCLEASDPSSSHYPFTVTLGFGDSAYFQGDGAGLENEGVMHAHFQGKQRTLWGREKLPLDTHTHTHTHCPSLHVTINQLAPTCCLQTEFPTDVLKGVGWEKERKVELEAGEGEGGRGNLKRVKNLALPDCEFASTLPHPPQSSQTTA